MSCVSQIAPSVTSAGFQFGIGNAGSPETISIVANGHDLAINDKSDVQDVTNFCDTYHRRVPTLNDFGPVTFKIYWVMEEPTHRNSINGGVVAAGLRYIKAKQLLRDFVMIYPDGNNSTDSFSGYVVDFSITGQVGKVWEAMISIVNGGGTPSLV
jgi:hypothetical protein